jgi:hypothetical protein
MYSAKAIRVLTGGKVESGIVWIVDSGDCPTPCLHRRMHESAAREIYNITNLEIGETRAADSETLEIVNIK